MTPADAFHALRAKAPDFAHGLGWSQGDSPPQIMAEGPLYRGADASVGTDARWHIGSITKTLTATLALQQVDRGAVDLDGPIGPVLQSPDNMHQSWHSITLRQLLSHTSGLPTNPPLRLFNAWRALDTQDGLTKVLQTVWDRPVKGPKGRYRYSNLGYMLAGRVLEVATGRPWEDLLRDNIAAPIGLSSLGFGPPLGDEDPKGHRRYFWRSTPMARDSLNSDNPRWLGPAGTVHLSLRDLLTFGRAHLSAGRGTNPAFLSQNSALLMRQEVQKSYGLGFVLQDGALWHDGSNTMWYALLIIDPAADSVLVGTQNTTKGAMRLGHLMQKAALELRKT